MDRYEPELTTLVVRIPEEKGNSKGLMWIGLTAFVVACLLFGSALMNNSPPIQPYPTSDRSLELAVLTKMAATPELTATETTTPTNVPVVLVSTPTPMQLDCNLVDIGETCTILPLPNPTSTPVIYPDCDKVTQVPSASQRCTKRDTMGTNGHTEIK